VQATLGVCNIFGFKNSMSTCSTMLFNSFTMFIELERCIFWWPAFCLGAPPKNGGIALETPRTPLLLDFQWFSPMQGSLI
jgi:hypothetical protein